MRKGAFAACLLISTAALCTSAEAQTCAAPEFLNTMVMEPGGYEFGDYWKIGLPVLAWFFVVGVFWVPVVWSL